MGYKLADYSDSESYQIGDQFELVINSCGWAVGDIIELYGDVGSCTPLFKSVTGECNFYHCDGENGAYFDWENLKSYKKASFTISDLKDGMRVIIRDGKELVVIDDTLYNYKVYSGSYLPFANKLHCCDNFCSVLTESADIMKVIERDGTVLWQREAPTQPTQAEIEYAELQKTIKELQEKADSLGKLIK